MKRLVALICALAMMFSVMTVHGSEEAQVRGEMSMSYGMGRYFDANDALKGYCAKTGYTGFDYGYIVEYKGGFGGFGADASVRVDDTTGYDKLVFDARIISDDFCSVEELYGLFETPDTASYITKYSDERTGKVSLLNTSNGTMPFVDLTENWAHYEMDISDLEYFGVYIDALGAKDGNGETCAVIVANLKMVKDDQTSSDVPSQEAADNYYEMTQPSDWAAESVAKFTEYGFRTMAGNYQASIKREDFAMVIVDAVLKAKGTDLQSEIENIPHDKFVRFDDTKLGHVILAHAMGIVNGVGDNRFAPEQKITRQEIAVMIHRAINYLENVKGVDIVADNADIASFADASSVADWATAAVGTLANGGIMKGTSETTLSPIDNTTVEQAIILVLRVFELVK